MPALPRRPPPEAVARGSGGPSVASFLKLINCLPVPVSQATPQAMDGWNKPGDLAADEVSKEAIHTKVVSTEPSKDSDPTADGASKESMPASNTGSTPGSKPGNKPGSSNDHGVFQREPKRARRIPPFGQDEQPGSSRASQPWLQKLEHVLMQSKMAQNQQWLQKLEYVQMQSKITQKKCLLRSSSGSG